MLIETLNNYASIQKNIDKIIKLSGYKLNYIYDEMGMDATSFLKKRKQGKFTTDELFKLFTVIDVNKIEDKILSQISEISEMKNEFVNWNGGED